LSENFHRSALPIGPTKIPLQFQFNFENNRILALAGVNGYARATSDQVAAAAPPNVAMKSRRFIPTQAQSVPETGIFGIG
jgi:hypothetical protein